MNAKQRVKERFFALETASVRTEGKFLSGWLNLAYLVIGAWAMWRLVRVFWLG